MRTRAITWCLFCALLSGLAVGSTHSLAYRAPLEKEVEEKNTRDWLFTSEKEKEPPPNGEIEGACGLAISPTRSLYVSDYYHRVVDVYVQLGQENKGQLAFKGQLTPFGPYEINAVLVNTLDGVCGLAFDSAGKLYANEFHEGVLRLLPEAEERTIDSGESTGVAVDEDDNVYVDDRTYVAKYEAPVEPNDEPVEAIGIGSLHDAYGLAVFGGRVYVPDAADNTVKVFEPAKNSSAPVKTITGPESLEQEHFNSLVDAAATVDPTNGHLLVVDNLKPGFESPEAAVYEFDSPEKNYSFLGRLDGEPIDSEPPGLVVDPTSGTLYVTTGNTERSNVFAYGPYEASSPLAAQPPADASGPTPGALAAARRGAPEAGQPGGPAASASEVVQRGGVRVNFDGKLTPRALPRHGAAPVGIAVDVKIAATGSGVAPQLRQIAIAINRNGRFTTQGLPVCSLRDIQPSTTANALAACRGSLVGEGHFSANVKLPEQSPFPSAGKVLAFNGRLHGRPAILAHIYGTQPAPTSTVLPFLINDSHGTYGTILEASLPQATGDWGYVRGLKMTLRRRFDYRGKGRSYLSASCPAPAGFSHAAFPLARTSFAFAGGPTLVSILNRSCRAKG